MIALFALCSTYLFYAFQHILNILRRFPLVNDIANKKNTRHTKILEDIKLSY